MLRVSTFGFGADNASGLATSASSSGLRSGFNAFLAGKPFLEVKAPFPPTRVVCVELLEAAGCNTCNVRRTDLVLEDAVP